MQNLIIRGVNALKGLLSKRDRFNQLAKLAAAPLPMKTVVASVEQLQVDRIAIVVRDGESHHTLARLETMPFSDIKFGDNIMAFTTDIGIILMRVTSGSLLENQYTPVFLSLKPAMSKQLGTKRFGLMTAGILLHVDYASHVFQFTGEFGKKFTVNKLSRFNKDAG